MLDEKLATANRSASRQTTAIGGIGVLLVIIVSLVIWNLDLMTRGQDPATTQGDSADTKITPTIPSLENQDTTTSPPSPTDGVGRETFKSALRTFDDQFLSVLDDPGFNAWNAAENAALVDMRQAATNQFAQGQYATALATLSKTESRATTAIGDWDAAFEDAMQKAEIAVSDDDFDGASAAITTAGAYRPEDPFMISLASRVDALPAVLEALETIRVANVEGNLRAELAGIQEVMTLDPQRTVLAQRREEIESLLREQKFALAIETGLSNVEDENLEGGLRQLHTARLIYPNREETALLKSRVEVLQRTLDVRGFIADADRYAEMDDWLVASGFYRQALLLEPDNKAAQQGREIANEIVNLQQQMDATLAAPHRLSSSNVSEQALELVDRANVMSTFSARLKAANAKLNQLIQAYDQPVGVEVISDGETYITVRGVGKVGQTTGRTINLKPGKHTFEGSRQGYVSKLVEVDVLPNGQQISVTVVCDELI